ncbi:hypothetical protein ACIBCT_35765 [Streptosporangium sp. NPDC050855]|uniref:hypothetical protein n=1 Tax=Streptosporangium sp. NPDC050855 TaxID=3366194 RepID=UPI0037AF9E26
MKHPTVHVNGREYEVVEASQSVKDATDGAAEWVLRPTARQQALDRLNAFLDARPKQARGLHANAMATVRTAAGDFDLLRTDLELLLGRQV